MNIVCLYLVLSIDIETKCKLIPFLCCSVLGSVKFPFYIDFARMEDLLTLVFQLLFGKSDQRTETYLFKPSPLFLPIWNLKKYETWKNNKEIYLQVVSYLLLLKMFTLFHRWHPEIKIKKVNMKKLMVSLFFLVIFEEFFFINSFNGVFDLYPLSDWYSFYFV